jgi:hypothetical protein
MKTRIAPLATLFLFLLTFLASVNGSVRHLDRDDITGHVGSTREEVLAQRNRRKVEFTRKLEVLKQQWEDHVSGSFPLKEGFEANRVKKKIKGLEHKIEYLTQEVDDRVSGFGSEILDEPLQKYFLLFDIILMIVSLISFSSSTFNDCLIGKKC